MNAKRRLVFWSALLILALHCRTTHAATITYTYDAQHRLVQASYTASQKEFFNHDAAGNVHQRVAITDAKYLESWLLYFSALDMLPMPGLAPSVWLLAYSEFARTVTDKQVKAL